MTLSRQIPRVMLSAMFIAGGIDSLRNPAAKVPAAEKVAPEIAGRLPLPDDTEQLVKINAAVQVGAGGLLALGKLPRLAALALSRVADPHHPRRTPVLGGAGRRAARAQRIHFLKNVGLLGGLLLAALDTEGRPSLRWRAERAATRPAPPRASVVESTRAALPVT